MEEEKLLPIGWVELDFKDSCEKISLNRIKIKEKEYKISGNFPTVDQGQNLIGGYFDNEELLVPFEPPYIIFGDHTKVKKFINFKFIAGGDGLKVLKAKEFYNPKLLFYFIHCIKIPDKGYARHYQYLEKEKVFLPPLPEQQRIVEKIEELFSELDKGIDNLKVAQQQLKVYRQAVLKWAFEGKLTEKWRNQRHNLVPVMDLLVKIDESRKIKCQDNRKKIKAVAPLTEEEIGSLCQIPGSWEWVKLSMLAELIGGITKGRDFKGKKTIHLPYLRVANVQDGYLDLKEMKEIELLEEEINKYLLQKNDILYTEGGDKDKLGRGTIWNNEIENCVHQNHIFRARIYGDQLIPQYIAYYSQTKTAKQYFYKKAKQTVNLASINMTVLSNLPIPIMDVKEQIQIVQEIESRLSVCDKMEETIKQSLIQAEALRQSILKKAFEGKLVPQDPNDEPAELLLARIKAEREVQAPEKKTIQRRAKK